MWEEYATKPNGELLRVPELNQFGEGGRAYSSILLKLINISLNYVNLNFVHNIEDYIKGSQFLSRNISLNLSTYSS